MESIGKINHPNNIIDAKVKVFNDYFHYFLSENPYLILAFQPLENHLSLLQKSIYRLDCEKVEPSSWAVIHTFLNNDLFDTNLDEFSRKGKYQILIKKLKTDLNEKNKPALLKGTKDLFYLFNDSMDFEHSEYLNKCCEKLVSFLACSCDVSKHKHQIIYLTKLIAAEFIRRNLDSDELTGFNGLIDKLISDEVIKNDKSGYIYSKFPLPTDLEKCRTNSEGFAVKVNEYLKNRTFEQQFKGIVNYGARKNYTSTFIVKIRNINYVQSLNIHYDEIKVVSPDNIQVDQSNWEEFHISHFNDFCSTENSAFVLIEINYNSSKKAIQECFEKTEEVLRYLSYPNIIEGYVDKSEVITLTNGKFGYSFYNNYLHISPENEYTPERMRFDNPKIYQDFHYLDRVYFKAFASARLEDRILNSWVYIEMLFSRVGFKDEKGIKKISKILMTEEEKYKRFQLEILAFNLASNNLDLLDTNDTQYFVYDLFKESRVEFVNYISTNNNYYFINDLLKVIDTPVDLNIALERYQVSLKYLYEQRNSIIHSSKFCSISVNYHLKNTHQILKRLRKIIMDDILNNKRKDIQDSLLALMN